ncbi:inositol monophosphatase [Calothrix sp. NIES-3974]|nr:inositol monophosphatase [Calothrix sp. NIES-3974]
MRRNILRLYKQNSSVPVLFKIGIKMSKLNQILEITRTVAWGAADILRSHYRGNQEKLDIQYKSGNDPVTVADIAVSNYIIQGLQAQLGNDDFGYISEETYNGQPSPQEYVWVIDPLDGTRNFIQKTGEYAIHIALVHQHRPVLAVVATPEAEKIYHATLGGGTYVEYRHGKKEKLQVNPTRNLEDLILLVSRSHRSEPLDYILQHLPCQNQQNVGSVGCKIAIIVEGKADAYISLSSKSAPKDWDIAAPELILAEAGGKYTSYDGSTLVYNTDDINKWGGFVASNGKYHSELCHQAANLLAQWHGQE